MSRAASDLGINRTTLIRLLHTLTRERMIEPDADGGGYVLSYGILEFASSLMASRDIVQTARPLLKTLARDTGLSSHLGVLAGREVVILARETPDSQLVSNIHVGSRLPAHATVMGRIILGHQPAEEVRNLLAGHDFPAITDQTSTTLDSFLQRIALDRKEGLAWSVAYFEPGIGSCAAAVLDGTGRAIAAISVSGQQAAFEAGSASHPVIARGVAGAAAHLSAIMTHMGQ